MEDVPLPVLAHVRHILLFLLRDEETGRGAEAGSGENGRGHPRDGRGQERGYFCAISRKFHP